MAVREHQPPEAAREAEQMQVRIENRAQLIYLLTEAAELEHEILCCYLFALFTMKDDVSEGVTAEQLEVIQKWHGLLRTIAVQEMIHLTTACNLLTAIGSQPQLHRPNLPTGSRAYPERFRLQLVPFGLDAVDQFVSLEQPEAVWAASQHTGAGAASVPLDRLSDIFSSERNFSTVGELYRGIRDGFSYLAQKLGEGALFVGLSEAQAAQQYFQMPGLIAVRDLTSAHAAIDVIVEQGEGASEHAEDSHYNAFVKIQQEYRAMLALDPHFAPARSVVTNPYAMLPIDLAPDAVVTLVDDPIAADLGNLFDGCYELMLQILGRLFAHGDETAATMSAYADIGVNLMFDAIHPLGRAITRMPAGPRHPGMNAGPSFRLSRSGRVPPHGAAARAVFRERFIELQRYCRFLQSEAGAPHVLGPLAVALEGYATKLA